MRLASRRIGARAPLYPSWRQRLADAGLRTISSSSTSKIGSVAGATRNLILRRRFGFAQSPAVYAGRYTFPFQHRRAAFGRCTHPRCRCYCFLTMSEDVENQPVPCPVLLVVKKGSNSAPASPRRMPLPVSAPPAIIVYGLGLQLTYGPGVALVQVTWPSRCLMFPPLGIANRPIPTPCSLRTSRVSVRSLSDLDPDPADTSCKSTSSPIRRRLHGAHTRRINLY